MSRRSALGAALAWGALAGLAAASTLATGEGMVDELIQAATAWAMLQGRVLYLDLHAFAGPLPQLLLAPLYAWQGPSLAAARFELWLALLLALGGLGLAVRRLGGSPWAGWAAGAFLVLGALPAYRGWYHHWLALPGVLAGLLLGGCALRGGGARAWAGAGLAAGLASATTQSTGAAIALALAGAWALGAAWGALGPRPGRQGLALAGGLVAPWAALSLAFASQGALGALWRSCWWWPFVAYRQPGGVNDLAPGRDLPALLSPMAEALSQPAWAAKAVHLSGLVLLPWAAGLVALGALLGLALRRARGPAAADWGQALEGGLWAAFLLLALGALARGRADVAHHAFLAPLAFAWAIAAASRWAGPLPAVAGELRWALRLPAGALLVLLLAASLHEAQAWRRLAREGALGWPDAVLAQDPLLKAFRRACPPGAPVVAFPEGGACYLLGGGRPATPYLLLTPQSYRYHGPKDRARFAAAWAARPPELVALTRLGAAEAVAEWGGAPNLRGYRRVFQGRTRLSGAWVPAELWQRVGP